MFGANSLNLRQTSVVMSVSFSQRVAQFIDSYHLLQDRDRIIVGLSGGADSVALWLSWSPLAINVRPHIATSI